VIKGDAFKNDHCKLCLESYKVGDVVARSKYSKLIKGGCPHWFHKDCILKWLEEYDECPLCRVHLICTRYP